MLEKENSTLGNGITLKSQEASSQNNLNETDLISETFEEFCIVPVPKKFSAWKEAKQSGQKMNDHKNGSYKSGRGESVVNEIWNGSNFKNERNDLDRVSSNLKTEKSDFESPFPTESKNVTLEINEAPARKKFIKFEE